MNTLKYYSIIIISLFTAITFVDFIANEDVIALVAFILYLPIAIYFWKLGK